MSDSVTSILHEAYDEPGEANIVLVHGALDRGMAFRGLMPRLGTYDVTVYDRRGYGASLELGANPDVQVHVDDLLGVIGSVPSVVVGHSFGGYLAMRAAVQHPELIKAIGVYESPFPGAGSGQSAPDPNSVAPEDDEAFVRWFYGRVADEAVFDNMGERAKAALIAEAPALRADIRSNVTGSEDDPGRIVPADITQPTLVGYGGDSQARHIERAKWLANALPQGSAMEVPGAKHNCHRSHPAEFAGFIKAVVALA